MWKILTEKGGKIKIDEYQGPMGKIKGFEFTIGEIIAGDEEE